MVNKKFNEATKITTFVMPDSDKARVKDITIPLTPTGKVVSFGDRLRYAVRIGLAQIEQEPKPAQPVEPTSTAKPAEQEATGE